LGSWCMVNHDPEPFVQVYSHPVYSPFSRRAMGGNGADHDPRPEYETNDPYPWVIVGEGRTDDDRLADPGWTTFWDQDTESVEFRPRREEYDNG
jgi:hypothetical protein